MKTPAGVRWLPLLLGLTGAVSASGQESQPPNLVLVLADDLGWRDVGYNRVGDYVETPSIDRLASQGMTFTSAYASAGNCAPSRACLLSGQYTPRHGVYAVGDTNRGNRRLMRLLPTPNKKGLTPQAYTLAEALRDSGYATACIGKWHLAGPDGATPNEQGFDVAFDSFGDGAVSQGKDGNHKGPPDDPKGVYALTARACEFVREHRDKPFYLHLAHHAIHAPLQAEPGTRAKYDGKGAHSAMSAEYAACTEALDTSVGRLMACLQELGLERNTLVVFTSDNGATPDSDQEPLRGRKGCYYEGGIRVPMMVRWPGTVAPGTQTSEPVSNIDLYPTFLAAAGTGPRSGYTLDGADLSPVLRGGALGERPLYWCFPGYLNGPVPRGRAVDTAAGFRTRPVTVVRQGRWKLHLFEEEWALDGGWNAVGSSGAVELYDLQTDLGERNNLASSRPEVRDRLLKQLLAWREGVGEPPLSKPHPAFDPDAVGDRGPRPGRRRAG